jgi:hypothetical protein
MARLPRRLAALVAALIGISVGAIVCRLAFSTSSTELVPPIVSATVITMMLLWRRTTPQKR